jgi:hypothetical protein
LVLKGALGESSHIIKLNYLYILSPMDVTVNPRGKIKSL